MRCNTVPNTYLCYPPCFIDKLSKKVYIVFIDTNRTFIGTTNQKDGTNMSAPLFLKSSYDSPEFREKYTYDGDDLGAVCKKGSTSFALWSPLAKSVQVCLYEDGAESSCCQELNMVRDAHGVWRSHADTSLHGKYYQYRVSHGDIIVLSADPYARGCGLNGDRSMVVDLSRTDPEGWQEDIRPEKPAENIIYELHVKEFSWQEAAGFPKEFRGKYKAFTVQNTTLHNDGIHPTGIGYLQELGVTYVELMPVYDFGSVDERHQQDFNWGYDPVNYNVPEGSYSTDPAHGEVRIREFKEMIQSLHKNGFRVIMDVVYNHTYTLGSWLNRCVPCYYYRLDARGSAGNGSGCGNEIASEYPMCANYILQSVLYWAGEYHIDGFRFDLMGLLDVELMNRIRSCLDEIYGKGQILMFGEPWAAGPSAMLPTSLPASKDNVGLLDENIGIFCDNTRDSIKGHVFDSQAPGFVNGGQNLEDRILSSVAGWHQKGTPVKAPSQIISYVSAHDNFTLWDKLQMTVEDNTRRLRCNKLAAAIYMTCQGSPFFLSGEEFARTKRGMDNTYNAPISVNLLDWERAYQYSELRDYYRGLIALRKQLSGLCDKSPKNRILKSWTSPGFAGLYFDNAPSRWSTLCILYNSTDQPVTVSLPAGVWQLLVDGVSSFRWQKQHFIQNVLQVSPVSAMVLGISSSHKDQAGIHGSDSQ